MPLYGTRTLKSQEIKAHVRKKKGADVLKLIGFEVKEVRRNAENKPPRGRMFSGTCAAL